MFSVSISRATSWGRCPQLGAPEGNTSRLWRQLLLVVMKLPRERLIVFSCVGLQAVAELCCRILQQLFLCWYLLLGMGWGAKTAVHRCSSPTHCPTVHLWDFRKPADSLLMAESLKTPGCHLYRFSLWTFIKPKSLGTDCRQEVYK